MTKKKPVTRADILRAKRLLDAQPVPTHDRIMYDIVTGDLVNLTTGEIIGPPEEDE